MLNYSKQTAINPKQFVTPTSRYIRSKIRSYTEDKILSFETYKRKPNKINGNEQYAEITPQVQYRPDLVSFEMFGTPDYWWKILEINGMKDVMEFQTGKIIRLPNNVFE